MHAVICATCCHIGPPPDGALTCCSERKPVPLRLIPLSLAQAMTGISWTTYTANPWAGCTAIPASRGGRSGCLICYARTMVERKGWARWGAGEPRIAFVGWVQRVRRLNRMARETGLRFSLFSLSLGDWLDPEVDPAWRAALAAIIEECDALDWLLLTHRPHLVRKLAPASWLTDLPPHVWPGVTIEHWAHGFRFAQICDVWGECGRLWVSAEPLAGSLAAVDLSAACCVIVGGASNTADPEWAPNPDDISDILERYAGRVHFKQWGVFNGEGVHQGRKEKAGREMHGAIHDWTPWPRHRQLLASAEDFHAGARDARNGKALPPKFSVAYAAGWREGAADGRGQLEATAA